MHVEPYNEFSSLGLLLCMDCLRASSKTVVQYINVPPELDPSIRDPMTFPADYTATGDNVTVNCVMDIHR